MTKTLDVITIGRSSVDLYGDQVGGRLEDMRSFSKYVGGSPTNIACGTARLGLKSAVITGVGDEHMGRFIIEQLARAGVDTRGVKVDPERLTALVLLGIRDDERFPLIFYRENCADMGLTEADIDEGFIAEARAVLATGLAVDGVTKWADAVEGTRIDADGRYGAQCVDLVKSWAAEHGIDPAEAFGNGKDVAANLGRRPGWAFKSATATPATRLSPPRRARPPSKPRRTDRQTWPASGVFQDRPRRPRPAVWRSASSTSVPAGGGRRGRPGSTRPPQDEAAGQKEGRTACRWAGWNRGGSPPACGG